jgi:pyrimidine-nucleoside phosphorylase
VDLDETEFRWLAKANGIVLAGQSLDLAPADGKLYALRDVTGTVPSLPLIVSSIMSKKIAAGAHGIVLDVKVGSGAFMKTLDEAHALAAAMVEIGDAVGRDMIACVSDMNQPLGEAVGNTLEVIEALDTLRGGGPDDLREHCVAIAAHMLTLAGRGRQWTDPAEVRALLTGKLKNGEALATFRKLVAAQGGDTGVIDHPERFSAAAIIETYSAERDGWVARADAEAIARMAFELGAGREKKGASLDHAVGVVLHRKVGEQVRAGDSLLTWYANDVSRLERCKALLGEALEISASPVEPLPLFYEVLYGERVKSR